MQPDTANANIDLTEVKAQGWELRNDALAQDFTFADFSAAMAFVTQVALASESADHHPSIHISYNKVTIDGMCTHDAGGAITGKDVGLCKTISKLSEGA